MIDIVNKLNWLIGGEAGYGIMSIGVAFSKICSRGGLHIFDYVEYPSLIRGGHNAYYVSVEDKEVFSQKRDVNLLIALNRETIDLHKNELSPDAGIIYDSETVKIGKFSPKISLYPVPLIKFAQEIGKDKLMMNTVALGACVAVVDYDFDLLASVIKEQFTGKGDEIVNVNINSARAGYDYVKKNFKNKFHYQLKKTGKGKSMIVSGNDAFCLGAIKAGCKFLAAYPMTPINSILHYMKAKEKECNFVVVQPEDEIAAINLAIGASYAGVRSMTCSSGGGFSLMVEALGMAGITETPLVIVESGRGGPSSGLPTWTEQGDLRFLMHASQGEFPRIILAPGDVDDCFYFGMQAFNLAEKYQLPVFLIMDKYVSESHKSTKKFNDKLIKIERGLLIDEDGKLGEKYERYKFTDSGISKRAVPGLKNRVVMTSSYEHSELGLFDDGAENHVRMMDKRLGKLKLALKDAPKPVLYGPKKAKLTIIGWGSTKYPILEALKTLNEKKAVANYLQITSIIPFHSDIVAKVMDSSKTLIIENNATAQLRGVIRENTLKTPDYTYLKYDSRPFYPEDIVKKVHGLIK